jgi:lysophospholipase L1-like esterase
MTSEKSSPTPRWILLFALSLGVPFLLLFAYNYSSIEINLLGTPLKKITTVDSLDLWLDMASNLPQENDHNYDFPWLSKFEYPEDSAALTISVIPLAPGILLDSLLSESEPLDSTEIQSPDSARTGIIYLPDTISFSSVPKSDSSEQRILFMGDSQAGGLLHIFNDYCVENGHKMVAAHVWNSATIYNYGFSKRVDELINQYQPTLIVIVLGLNELHARDIAKRTQAANLLRAKFGNIPYLWVGPANYMEDSGINKVYEQVATSERFVLSKHLNLPKGSDKRHPNREGYKIWMDYIARAL